MAYVAPIFKESQLGALWGNPLLNNTVFPDCSSFHKALSYKVITIKKAEYIMSKSISCTVKSNTQVRK